MKLSPILFIFILLIPFILPGESLWDPDFNGYISSQTHINEGDILIVLIDTAFSLSHVSTQKDSKTITFEYTGGEYGNLFSFLPNIKTGLDNNVKGGESYSLQSEMVVRVVTLEDGGRGYIEGSREITIDSKKESITLAGYINTKDIDQHRQIPFSKIADSRLVFQTFLYPREFVLTEEDIEEIIEELVSDEPVIPGEVTAEGEETTVEPVTEGVPADGVKRQTRLSKEKKIELFLKYVNRMIDLLF